MPMVATLIVDDDIVQAVLDAVFMRSTTWHIDAF
jgi:hypothetical protein